MSDIGLTHIALPVRSLEESIAFYSRYASMSVVHRRPQVAWLSDRTRPFVIVIIADTAPIIPLTPPAHLGVGVSSRQELERLCHLAKDEGCLISEPEDSGPPVGYWAFLRDPDGHCVELSFGQDVGFTVESTDA